VLSLNHKICSSRKDSTLEEDPTTPAKTGKAAVNAEGARRAEPIVEGAKEGAKVCSWGRIGIKAERKAKAKVVGRKERVKAKKASRGSRGHLSF
jgi:hypothetical protein